MTSSDVTNVLLIGVGGQGVILVSDILALALMKHGYDVKKSEVHGMAQRGGSVSSHVRFGPRVYSPLIMERKADYILAFEEMEALRYLPFVNRDTLLILNRHQVNPPSVLVGAARYPQDVSQKLSELSRLQSVDGPALAAQLKNPRTVNIIILGVLANYIDVPDEAWLAALGEVLPTKLHEINKKAFLLGREQKLQ